MAAAQHTITSDNQGQRGHGGKRDRSKSIVPNVSNEVHWEMEGKGLSFGHYLNHGPDDFLESISISVIYLKKTWLLHCFRMYHIFIHGSD